MGKWILLVVAAGGIAVTVYLFVVVLYMGFLDRRIILAPLEVISADKSPLTGTQLAVMLQARLAHLRDDFKAAQDHLIELSLDRDERVRGTSDVPRPARSLRAELLTAVLTIPEVKISVGGVEVGKLWSWVSDRLVDDRTLRLSLSYEGSNAVITGDLKPLTGNDADYVEATASTNASQVAELLACILIKRSLVKQGDTRFDALTDPEFASLVTTFIQIDRLSRRGQAGRDDSEPYRPLLPAMEKLARKLPWTPIHYLTASLAEIVEPAADGRAVIYYAQALLYAGDDLDDDLRTRIRQRLHDLDGDAEDRIKLIDDIRRATSEYNAMFQIALPFPDVVFDPVNTRNAYWEDGTKTYHAPTIVARFPDVTYIELAHRYVWRVAHLRYAGVEGAIASSYSDILASALKQKRNHESADSADWTLAPGAMRWLLGRDESLVDGAHHHDPDQRQAGPTDPVRSLRAPGTAFHGDVQVASYDPKSAPVDPLFDDVHVRSGIANRAFFLTATALHDTQRALALWLRALPILSKQGVASFPGFAEILCTQAEPGAERDAVCTAWREVGVPIACALSASARP